MVYNSSKSSSPIFRDGKIRPGVYKIRNIVSKTYVDIKDDVRELCGRPSLALEDGRDQVSSHHWLTTNVADDGDSGIFNRSAQGIRFER
jgi:hypothetical protein